ncbi:Uncharacterised protein [Neisseria meningitidis]|nr:Uncharacterised protein [Neisseria meningitidis]
MAHGRGKVVGKRGGEKPEKAYRADHGGRRRHQCGNPKQYPQGVARVADAQIDGLVAPQKVYVQAVAFAPNDRHADEQNQRAYAQKLAVDGIESGKHIRLRRGKFFGVNHARKQRGKAAEQNPENHAD